MYETLRTQVLPNYLQIIGFIIGLIGAFFLVIPQQMYSLIYMLTKCQKKPETHQEA